MTTHDSYSYSLWLMEKSSLCVELLFQVRLPLCCLPHPTSSSTASFFFWSVLSHWLSWHTQTETLLMSIKAFSSPQALLEATKHQLSWPAITFSPLSVSRLSTCHTPSSPPLCVFPPAHWHLNFPLLYLSSLHLHLFFALTFTQNVYHVFSISPAPLLRLLHDPCSIISQTDLGTIQLWMSFFVPLYHHTTLCVHIWMCVAGFCV